MATPEGFARDPVRVHGFYNLRRAWHKQARPNAAHLALARLEREHGNVLTVTQNIDALHEAAGTKNLIHMHGELERALCAACGVSAPWTEDLSDRDALRVLRASRACAPTWCGSARCRARWSASTRRLAPATCSSPSARAARSIRRQASCSKPRAAGAHAVELNLEPSDGADLFLERIEGPATEIVPAYVDRLLA